MAGRSGSVTGFQASSATSDTNSFVIKTDWDLTDLDDCAVFAETTFNTYINTRTITMSYTAFTEHKIHHTYPNLAPLNLGHLFADRSPPPGNVGHPSYYSCDPYIISLPAYHYRYPTGTA